jgi:hypothetical protein
MAGAGLHNVTLSQPTSILKESRAILTAPMMQPNGTRFGGWLHNIAANQFGPAADYDGDRCAEPLITSPLRIGILQLAGSTLTAPMMQPNGTRFSGWPLNTADNEF